MNSFPRKLQVKFIYLPPQLTVIFIIFPILQLIPLFKEWGATGLLLEWEDTFPFQGTLATIGSKKEQGMPYNEDEIKQIFHLAKECGLITIPLIQTFGHLEVILNCSGLK